MEYLEKIFENQWQCAKCAGEYREGFKELVRQYNTPKRYYHTFEEGHIEFCIKTFFKHVVWQTINPITLVWQLLLHDSVMNFRRNDNDELSAQYAKWFLTKYGVSDRNAQKVAQAIMYHNHKTSVSDVDIKLALDIDLFILAQPQNIFDEYEANIKKEYSWMEEGFYKRGRVSILEGFLKNRESVFLTEYFQDRFEQIARSNLKYSIACLKGKM
jgi:predicted metal-dependent HD superfamily phosphohydrolase